jgi:hypothetical protein
MRVFVWPILILVGCGTPPSPLVDAGTDAGFDAGTDAGFDAGSKADNCASTFAADLTTSFGRFDGIVTAVVTPADTQCPKPNSDHVVIQVRSDGGIYRMVVNVLSSFGDPDVRLAAISAPLLGGPWTEGWHPGLTLDYPTSLGMHSADGGFTPLAMPLLIQRVSDEITIGVMISVFADSSGGIYSDSTHKIHRNGSNRDGALVLNPEAASARWLLFHFANQTF